MDPEACLAILGRAACAHQLCRECGAAARTECCLPGSRLSPADAEGRTERQQPAPDSESEAQVCGQIIDLQTGENTTAEGKVTEEELLELFPELRPLDVEDAVVGLSDAELAAAIVRLHEERVRVYKAYDGAFQLLLSARRGPQLQAFKSVYPSVVALATGRFKGISDAVRSAAKALEDNAVGRSCEASAEAALLIRQLQSLEQARLQLVALQHVEEARVAGRRDSPAASRELQLRKRRDAAAEEIEETISELRHCVADLLDGS